MNSQSTGAPDGWPDNWSHPSPVYVDGRYQSGGMVWVGQDPATIEDVEALYAYYGREVDIDMGSIPGKGSDDYTSFYLEHNKPQRVVLS